MRTRLSGPILLLACALLACDSSDDRGGAPAAGASGTSGTSGDSGSGGASGTGGTSAAGTGGASVAGAGGTGGAGAAGAAGQATAGTGGASAAGAPPDVEQARSTLPRDDGSAVSEADRQMVVADNNAFAVSLYDQLRALPTNAGKNLWFSPISFTMALGMTSAGAVGQTQDEIRQAMHFTLPDAQLHPALNWLSLELAKRPQQARDHAKTLMIAEPSVGLSVVNSTWGERTYPWKSTFLDVLARSYGTGMYLGDFKNNYEQQRQLINEWVAYQTDQLITDLLPDKAFDDKTRLALVNAVALAFPWNTAFDEKQTKEAPFTVDGGTTKNVTTMSGGQLEGRYVRGRYAEDTLAEAVALPLFGEKLSLVVYVPKAGQFAAFESNLAAEVASLTPTQGSGYLSLSLPRVSLPGASQAMGGVFKQMGMDVPYKDQCVADFSAMLPLTTDCLHIAEIYHQATLDIDERGLKATAATAVVISGGESSPTGKEVHVDRSFVLGIRDDETGAMLFLGRILDPSQH